jgi:hypothetical protein
MVYYVRIKVYNTTCKTQNIWIRIIGTIIERKKQVIITNILYNFNKLSYNPII